MPSPHLYENKEKRKAGETQETRYAKLEYPEEVDTRCQPGISPTAGEDVITCLSLRLLCVSHEMALVTLPSKRNHLRLGVCSGAEPLPSMHGVL